jgi:hemin uptake protein HemP
MSHSPPPRRFPAPRAALPPARAPAAAPRWKSEDLLQGAREVEIEHDHHTYRLRVTSLGKLILTK